MKKISIFLWTILGWLVLCSSAVLAQQNKRATNAIFPQGERITNQNFTGTAYLKMLVNADMHNPTAVGNVTFEPKARTRWHMHAKGQIILALDGIGYYQEKGQDKKVLRRGDVVKCPANVLHWHGASTDSYFVQIAITDNYGSPTIWAGVVTDDEYNR